MCRLFQQPVSGEQAESMRARLSPVITVSPIEIILSRVGVVCIQMNLRLGWTKQGRDARLPSGTVMFWVGLLVTGRCDGGGGCMW